MTPTDLTGLAAASIADWCEANGVDRVDLATALLGVGAPLVWKTRKGRTIARGRQSQEAIVTTDSMTRDRTPERDVAQARAAALAVAAMHYDLEEKRGKLA